MKTNDSQNSSVLQSAEVYTKSSIVEFFAVIGLSALLKDCSIKSQCGYKSHTIFIAFFIPPFVCLNIFLSIVTANTPVVSKDAVYDYLKCTSANWGKLLLEIGRKLILFCTSLNGKRTKTVLVIDDTSYYKNSSKRLELLAKKFDHAKGVFYKGFEVLNFGWTDGFSFIPLFFNLVSTSNKKCRINEASKKVDPRSNAAKRRNQAVQEKPNLVLDFIEKVKKLGLKVSAVTCDSWFAIPKLIIGISKYYPVVCMMKVDNTRYIYNDKFHTIEQIYWSLKKKPGRAKIACSALVTVLYQHDNIVEKQDAKIVFVRFKKSNWAPILCSNQNFSDEDIVKLYGMRWSIETFHQDVKSHLNFAKGSQSTDFDAQVADTAFTYIRYAYLAYMRRKQADTRSICELSRHCCAELEKISLEAAMDNLVSDALAALQASDQSQKYVNSAGELCFSIKTIAQAFNAQKEKNIDQENLSIRQKKYNDLGRKLNTSYEEAISRL